MGGNSGRRLRARGWWGAGPSPAERWPGVTLEIAARWIASRKRWESHGGRYYYDAAAADKAVQFFPKFLSHHIGEFAGVPFDLLPYQEWTVVRPIFGWKHAKNNRRRFRKAFLFVPKGGGKALDVSTPIPTPTGWSTMGAISVGESVIDEMGNPVVVTGASDVMHGRPCFRVEFDDGTKIIADADHLWWTEHRRPERSRLESLGSGLKTTSEIARTLRYPNGQYQSANHSIPLAQPLDLPDADLQIEPYTLGVWLGDGDSDCARVTVGAGDLEAMTENLVAVGTTVGALKRTQSAYRIRVGGVGLRGSAGGASLNAALRREGLLHRKRIPREYLRASRDQRFALLQGLMDTDGSITASSGACEFCSMSSDLAVGVHALIVSLGIKATISESDAVLYGRTVGRRWRIQFHPDPERPVFRLPRKAEQQRRRHDRRRLSGERRIVACEPVPPVPVRCIEVASPTGMFLAGSAMVPTHNSPLAAGIGLYMMLCCDEPAAEVYAVAADRNQARIVHTNAKVMVEESSELAKRCEVLRDSIYSETSRSKYQVLSADAGTKHGFRPFCVIFDEFHAQRTRDLYEALWKSMGKRREPLMMLVSHAGDNEEAICFEEYEYAKGVLGGLYPDEAILPVIFEAKPGDDWTDPALWPRVNPGHGITIQTEAVAAECEEAKAEPRKLNDFLRFHLNRWVNDAVAWIPVDWWDGCTDPLPPRAELAALPVAVGVDMAQKIDLAAAVAVFRLPLDESVDPEDDQVEIVVEDDAGNVVKRALSLNYRIAILPTFWLPEDTLRDRVKHDRIRYDIWRDQGLLQVTDGAVIDSDAIVDAIKSAAGAGLVKSYPLLKQGQIGYDPAFATEIGIRLEARGLTTVEVLQNYKHLSEACQVFEALVKAGRVLHGGHPILRWMLENTSIKRDDAGRIRPVKPKRAAKRIDGVVATLIALSRIMTMPPPRKRRRPFTWTPEGFSPIVPSETPAEEATT